MKREDLKALGLTDEQIDKVMAENGKDVNALKTEVDTLKTTNASLDTTLKDTQKQLKSFSDMDIEAVKAAAKEWETKYTNETKTLKEQLDKQAYEHKVDTFLSSQKFTSERVKKQIKAEFLEKGFKLAEDGKFEGANEYLESVKKEDPNVFVADNNKPTPPSWTTPQNQTPPTSGGFQMNFTGVRAQPTKE